MHLTIFSLNFLNYISGNPIAALTSHNRASHQPTQSGWHHSSRGHPCHHHCRIEQCVHGQAPAERGTGLVGTREEEEVELLCEKT